MEPGHGGTALGGWIGFADRFVVESNPTKESVRARCRITQMERGNIAELDKLGTYRMLAFPPAGWPCCPQVLGCHGLDRIATFNLES